MPNVTVNPVNSITVRVNQGNQQVVQGTSQFVGSPSDPAFTLAAFNEANAAYALANSAYTQANTGTLLAQSAFNAANNVFPQIQPAYNTANAAFLQANAANSLAQSAYNAANLAGSSANTLLLQGAMASANANIALLFSIDTYQNNYIASVNSYAYSAYAAANLAGSSANTLLLQGAMASANANIALLFAIDNAQNTTISAVNNYSYSAYAQANSAAANTIYISGVDLTQNASITYLQGALNTSNTNASANLTYLQGVNAGQNTNISAVNTYASAAYNQANVTAGGLVTANANIVYLQGALNTANANGQYLWNVANTTNASITVIQSVDLTQNTIISASFSQANTVNILAQASYNQANVTAGGLVTANASIAVIQGVDLTQNNTITASFSQANNANLLAQAAFNKANTGGTFTGAVNITNTSASALNVAGSVIIAGDLTLTGNLNISGTANTYNSNTLNVADPMIYLAANNSGNAVDIGFVGHFVGGGHAGDYSHYQHTGFVRDFNDNKWKLFSNVSIEPSTTVTFDANTVYDTIKVGGIDTPTANIGGIDLYSSLGNLSGGLNTANANIAYVLSVNLTQNNSISASYSQANTANILAQASYNQANVTAGGLISANANTTLLFSYVNSANANIAALWTTSNNALPNTGSLITVNGASQVVIANTTSTSSNSTGALVVKGGIGTTGSIYSTGGSITINNGLGVGQPGSSGTINLGDGSFTKSYGGSWTFGGGVYSSSGGFSVPGSPNNNAGNGYNFNSLGVGMFVPFSGYVGFQTNNANTLFLTAPSGAGANANYVQISAVGPNANTSNAVTISAQGTDANVSILMQPKGTGAFNIQTANGVNLSSNTSVTALTRTTLGSGYTSFPTVTISPPTTPGGVQATASVGSMVNLGATVQSGGTGYSVNDVLTVVGGTPTGVAATLTVTSVSSGVITSVSATNFGQYTVLPTNPVSVTGGTGSSATLNLTWTIGTNPSFTITNAGSGYVEQPTVTISGGGGSGATGYAIVGTGTSLKTLSSTMDFYVPSGIGFRVNDGGAGTTMYLRASPSATSPTLDAFGSAGDIHLNLASRGVNAVRLYTNQGAQLQFQASHTASAVNYVQVTGSATGNAPVISTQGSDSNVTMNFVTKGSNGFVFQTRGGGAQKTAFTILDGGSSTTNSLTITPSNTGVAPILASQGADTNIDLAITPKGTGGVILGNNQVNYAKIYGGATGNTVQFQSVGSDANVSMTLATQGTGSLFVTANTTIINQNYNGGTGALQVTGNTSIAGSTVSQNLYLAGNNNLFQYSNTFSNAVWNNRAVTITGSQSDPFGGSNATLLVATNAAANHALYNNSITLNATAQYTISLYVKASGYTLFYISDYGTGTFSCSYNLTAVTATPNNGCTGTITAVPGTTGWYRLTLTTTGTVATNATPGIIAYPSGTTLSNYALNFTGDGTSGAYIYGAQIESGSIASPYTPTTTTAITQTNNLYIPTGNIIGSPTVTGNLTVGGNLVITGNVTTVNYETVLYTETANVITANAITVSGNTISQNLYLAGNNNLLTYSQNFATNGTGWQVPASVTVTIGNTAPNGTSTANFCNVTSTSNYLASLGITVIPLATYTFSFYALAGTTTTPYYAVYNVSASSYIVTSTNYYSQINSSTWTRITTTFTVPLGCTQIYVYMLNQGSSLGTISLWGAQLELGSIASPYTPTTSTAISTLNNLYIPTDSAIGIGTTSPNAAIHIVQDGGTGPGSIPEIILDNPSPAGANYAAALQMRVQSGGSYTQSGIIYDWYGNYYTTGTNITSSHGMNYISGRQGQANHQFRNYSNTTQAIITDVGQSGVSYGQTTNGVILTGQYIANQNWLQGGYYNYLQVTGNSISNGTSTMQNVVLAGQNNLFTYSQDFTQSVWQKSNTIINSSTGLNGPDNITIAQSVTANQATGNGSIYRTTTVSNQNGYYTFSFYVAANTVGSGPNPTIVYATLGTGNNYSTNTTFSFPLQGTNPISPTFVSSNGITANAATTQRGQNGFYKCTISGLLYDPTNSGVIRTDIIIPTNVNSNSSVYIWGTQLEQGSQVSNYTPTGATAILTNNNLITPTGNVQAVNTLVSNKVNWVNSNNASVMYQYYNGATNSYDLVFG